MAVSSATMISNSTLFIRDLLLSNVTDPISTTRPDSESFVMTSYPSRTVTYPIITVKHDNSSGQRLGMNTESMVFALSFEIRAWARNVKEKDEITDDIIDSLRTKQKDNDGTINEQLVHMAIESAVDIDEDGETGTKSKVITITLEYFAS